MLINRTPHIFCISILLFLLLLTSCSRKTENGQEETYTDYEVTNSIVPGISGNSFHFFLENDSFFTAICNQNEITVIENRIDGEQQNKISLEIEHNYEIEDFCRNKEGGFYFLIKKTNVQTLKNNYEIKMDYRIISINENGTEKGNNEVKKDAKTPDHETITSEGIFFSYGKELYYYDTNGKEKYKYILDGEIDSIAPEKNSNIYTLVQKGPKETLYIINTKNNEVTACGTIEIPLEGNFYMYPAAEEEPYDLYISSQKGMYAYKEEKGQIDCLFSWTNCDLNGQQITGFSKKEEAFFVLWNNGQECEIKKIEKSAKREQKEGLIIGAAGLSGSTSLEYKILEWNETHQECPVTLRDYSAYEDSYTRFSLDVVSGNAPDILMLDSVFIESDFDELFEDLYPYMETDPDVGKEDISSDILRLCEDSDGHLYSIPVSFKLLCLMTDQREIGDTVTWTLEEMQSILTTTQKDTFFNTSGESFFNQCFRACYQDYITASGKFSRERLIQLLKICSNLQTKQKTYDISSELASIKQGEILLSNQEIFNGTIFTTGKYLYGETGYSLIGYPSFESSGIIVQGLGNSPAIIKSCAEKEMAWEFIKQFYQLDYQNSISNYALPVRTESLEQWQKERKGKKGKQLNSINFTNGPFLSGDSLTQRDIKILKQLMKKADLYYTPMGTFYEGNIREIINIVQGESKSYFSGDKSAEETAEIIGNRIELYYNEKT